MEILNERPKNMTYERYRHLLREQKEYIRKKLEGKIIFFTSPSLRDLSNMKEMALKAGLSTNDKTLQINRMPYRK